MKKFFILHPLNGELNTKASTTAHSFEKIAELTTVDVSHAYYAAQNDFNEEYAKLGKRSTSVGDIIVNVTDGIMYMVEGSYFSVLCNHEHLLNEQYHGAAEKMEWNEKKFV